MQIETRTITKITLNRTTEKEKYEELLKDPNWFKGNAEWVCGEDRIVSFYKEDTTIEGEKE